MSVLVVGSIALDSVETPFGRVSEAQGGSASYAAVAAAQLAPVRVVGVVGEDFPPAYRRVFRRPNIDGAGIEVVKGGRTFRWSGVYHYDMNSRDTLETQLNVFAGFRPTLPDGWNNTPFVFLGNIHPALQLQVLEQMRRPRCVVCDTMNLWIETTPREVEQLFRRVHAVVLNDAEARQFCAEPNLFKAARKLLRLGPRIVVIKKGEHGCLLFTRDQFFAAPAYPLQNVKDPTGAGDTFAGGFIGWLARAGRLSPSALRQAVVVGSAMASFCVEDFSLKRLLRVTPAQLGARCAEFARFSRVPRINIGPPRR
ncbi:MAG: PfkB family carbohydrate kinase [Candidatus Sumerlaeia bacterium]